MIDKSSQKIFNNSIMYAIGTIASKAVGFFLIPIYTYNMSNEEYGIATTIISFGATFGLVVMFSLSAAMLRFYNQYDEEEKKRFVGTIVSFVLLSAVAICLLLCLFQDMYVPYLFKEISFFPCVFWGILSMGIEVVYQLYQSLLQARQEGAKYSLNSMIYLFFHAVTVILFVLVLKMGAVGMVFSAFITNAVFAVYGLWSMQHLGYMNLKIDRKMLLNSLKYSVPILPHDLSNSLNIYLIKIIINRFLSYAWSGLFTLASQFATIINLVLVSVNLAFRPWFIEQMGRGEEGKYQIKHMSSMIMSLLSFCAVCISIYSKEIIILMAEPSYIEAWELVPWFVFTQLISFIYYSHVQSLLYNLNMSKYSVVASFTGLSINLLVSYCLVRKMGIWGILTGQIVSQSIKAGVTIVLSNRAEHVDFGLKHMLRDIAVAFVLTVTGMYISKLGNVNQINLYSFLLKILVVIAAFIIYICKDWKEYLELFQGILRKKKSNE